MEENSQLQYKCPCCGGKIEFESSIQKLKCPYCDTEYDVSSLKDYDDILNSSDRPDEMEWEENGEIWEESEDADNISVFSCKSCGGEIICEKTTAASSCPFCGNPVIMTGRLSGDLKPDIVIPFKYSRTEAKERLSKHFSGKKLLPAVFKDENHIDEIKGVYVPFWIYDADAEGHMTFRAERIRVWRAGNYRYTETSHFLLSRDGRLSFRGVPADGSEKMDDDLMQSIEPYDLGEAVDFQTAYLSGYLADRYDVTSSEASAKANERIRNTTERTITNSITGYSGVVRQSSSVSLGNQSVKYALLPVWVLNTAWKDKKYVFAMNGQTGKLVGNLPLDKKAAVKWFFIFLMIFGAVGFGLSLLFQMLGR